MSRSYWRTATAVLISAAISAASQAWTPTSLIPVLPTALNDSGQVVGVSSDDGQAAVWSSGVATALAPGGYATCPFAVSSTGLIAGAVMDADLVPSAVLWDATGLVDLGFGPGSDAWGVSAAGTVVGEANSQPFVWDGGVTTWLPMPVGAWGGAAYGIAGKYIVGTAYFGDGNRAVMWTMQGKEKKPKVKADKEKETKAKPAKASTGVWTVAAVCTELSSGRSVNSLGVAAIDLGLPGAASLPATWTGGSATMLPLGLGWTGFTCGINDAGTVLVQAMDDWGGTYVYSFQPSGTTYGPTDLSAEVSWLIDPTQPSWLLPPNMLNNLGAFVGYKTDEFGMPYGVLVQP